MDRQNSQTKIPQFVRPFLWSYDLLQIDLQTDKKVIIKNILDFGTREAVTWLKQVYSEEEIKEVIQNSVKTQWSKKSINFWSLIYEVNPKSKRF